MDQLAWSVVTLLASISISFLFRLLVSKLVRSEHMQTLCDEFIGNFVFATVMMELSVLTYAKYSVYLHFTCLFVYLFFKNLYFTALELYGTPLSFVDLYYSKHRKHEFTIVEVLSIIITQSSAALCGQWYSRMFWLYQDAVHRNAADEPCLSTLSESHVWYECVSVELAGTFICALVDFMMAVNLKPVMRPLVTCVTIYSFGHVTGTWMNPMLATVFTFRCHGHYSDLMHFVVYWAAPCVGLFLAWEVYIIGKKFFSNKSETTAAELKEKKKK